MIDKNKENGKNSFIIDAGNSQINTKKKRSFIVIIGLIIILFFMACGLLTYIAFLKYHKQIVYQTKKQQEEINTQEEDASSLSEMLEKDSKMKETAGLEATDEDFKDNDFGFISKNGGIADVKILKDIRFGIHDNYERTVLEFTNQKNNPTKGIPRYITRLGPLPYKDANGNNIKLNGSYYLQINFNGNIADLSIDTAPIVYKGPDIFNLNYEKIKQVKLVPTYENNSMILLLGLSKKSQYRVLELSKPDRLVLDIEK